MCGSTGLRVYGYATHAQMKSGHYLEVSGPVRAAANRLKSGREKRGAEGGVRIRSREPLKGEIVRLSGASDCERCPLKR